MAGSDVKHDYHLVDPSPWPIVAQSQPFSWPSVPLPGFTQVMMRKQAR